MLDFEEKGPREFESEEIRDLEVRKHTYTIYLFIYLLTCVKLNKDNILQRSVPKV